MVSMLQIRSSLATFLTRALLLYCGVQSFRSVDSNGWRSDNSWLVFWVIYAMLQYLEIFADFLLYNLPMYYEFKFLFYAYLALGGGATMLYSQVGQSLLKQATRNLAILAKHPAVEPKLTLAREQLQALQQKFAHAKGN
eukprot:RCo030227